MGPREGKLPSTLMGLPRADFDGLPTAVLRCALLRGRGSTPPEGPNPRSLEAACAITLRARQNGAATGTRRQNWPICVARQQLARWR